MERDWTEIFDEKALQIVGRVGACIASLPSAWFVADASHRLLQVPAPFNWIIAAVIESLGIGLADMAITCYVWNQDKSQRIYWRAPVIIPVVSYLVYLLATVGITVFLKTVPDLAGYAPILFPFLAVAGAFNWALLKIYNIKVVGFGRAKVAEDLAREQAEVQHQEELRQKRQERHKRRLEKMRLRHEMEQARVSGGDGESPAISGDGHRNTVVTDLSPVMLEHADRLRAGISGNGRFVVTEAGQVLGVGVRQARNIVRTLRQSGVLVGTDQRNRYKFDENGTVDEGAE